MKHKTKQSAQAGGSGREKMSANILLVVQNQVPHNVTKNDEEIRPVINIWSGELVTWDISKQQRPKLKPDQKCVYCDKKAHAMLLFTERTGRPMCYGSWAGMGCFYTKEMIEKDRKPLSNKERQKLIDDIIEKECHPLYGCIECHRTPKDEISRWHDERLKKELSRLKKMRNDYGTH